MSRMTLIVNCFRCTILQGWVVKQSIMKKSLDSNFQPHLQWSVIFWSRQDWKQVNFMKKRSLHAINVYFVWVARGRLEHDPLVETIAKFTHIINILSHDLKVSCFEIPVGKEQRLITSKFYFYDQKLQKGLLSHRKRKTIQKKCNKNSIRNNRAWLKFITLQYAFTIPICLLSEDNFTFCISSTCLSFPQFLLSQHGLNFLYVSASWKVTGACAQSIEKEEQAFFPRGIIAQCPTNTRGVSERKCPVTSFGFFLVKLWLTITTTITRAHVCICGNSHALLVSKMSLILMGLTGEIIQFCNEPFYQGLTDVMHCYLLCRESADEWQCYDLLMQSFDYRLIIEQFPYFITGDWTYERL